ncbi:hypothetical protein O181_051326 [Austropuccinia psidii MF-1]|uniref:Uncharacterized protein n=1 Tax=Austropuccinia psidii MF-1 TaxID=1389203 RepID=A0A9Q3E3J8_9BASI|nr:hypothetical protein [Austropuccinia psidii MF-1]
MEAHWLLENRASWTHKADPLFVTSPTTFPIMVHSCPTYVDFDNEICRNALLQQNEIEKKHVNRTQWLGHPKEENKTHGSLVIHLTERLLAQQILWGGLIFDGNFMRSMAYTPGPAQFFNCLKTGHQAFQWKEDPKCSKCGGTHSSQDCKDLSYTPSIRRCIQCVNQDKFTNQPVDLYNEKYHHSDLSQKCPIRQKEIQNLTPQPRINGK